jgi:hypothetical protein
MGRPTGHRHRGPQPGERNTGRAIKDVQRRLLHPVHKWMAATLDGLVDPGGAVFDAKFMLPWTFSEEGADKLV